MQGILDWIKTNKEWVFSGIGVLAITVLFVFGRGVLRAISHFFGGKNVRSPSKPQTDMEKAMADTHILFIDDDVKFKVVNILRTAGWDHTTIVKDISSLGEELVMTSHIFFIDINGVGKKLGFKDEGLGLALALKTRYPEKKVVIYSADTKAERFHEAWKKADTYLAKNADPYEFQQAVEDLALRPQA
jgi:ActR/RegA family two-component response regulator